MSAAGFVIVADVMGPGDAEETITTLIEAHRLAPLEFQAALFNITLALQGLEELASGAGTGSVDTSAVGPDARLLAGMCRARGLPIPEAPDF